MFVDFAETGFCPIAEFWNSLGKEGEEAMSIHRVLCGSCEKFAVRNIFTQIVYIFPTYDDAFDYLKEIEF